MNNKKDTPVEIDEVNLQQIIVRVANGEGSSEDKNFIKELEKLLGEPIIGGELKKIGEKIKANKKAQAELVHETEIKLKEIDDQGEIELKEIESEKQRRLKEIDHETETKLKEIDDQTEIELAEIESDKQRRLKEIDDERKRLNALEFETERKARSREIKKRLVLGLSALIIVVVVIKIFGTMAGFLTFGLFVVLFYAFKKS
jgi:hypothetical protein